MNEAGTNKSTERYTNQVFESWFKSVLSKSLSEVVNNMKVMITKTVSEILCYLNIHDMSQS